MNFNTILYRFGLDPDCFINEEVEVIKTDEGFIYPVRQRTDVRICPKCGSVSGYINDYDYVEINTSSSDQIKDILRIKKVRFKCRDCNITYTPEISGIDPHYTISKQTYNLITGDFTKQICFSDIGRRYGLSVTRIMQIFDEKIPYVPRGRMPRVLCIDEIAFKEEINQSYCCILYDHEERKITDIIKNRQLPYLHEYFQSISETERSNVKYFVSDMYDGYRTVCHKYFPYALHIIDFFHVVKLLTEAINFIRHQYVKRHDDKSYEINFMKTRWRLFLCRREKISDRYYTPRNTGSSIHYSDMVFNCLLKNKDLMEGYNILQDLYHYNRNESFTESLKFIDYISERLILTGNDRLESVGRSYKKWRIEIADGMAKNQTGKTYSNGVAESINNTLKTIIKCAYGYHNFDRFRRRAMIISRYKKI